MNKDLEIRVIFQGDMADAIRALAETYQIDTNEMAKRLITTGAQTTLGELQFRINAGKRK